MSALSTTRLRVAREPEQEPAAAVGPLAHSQDEAARSLRVSVRHVRRLIRAGALPAKKCGSRVLILDSDLRDYLNGLPSATMPR